MSSAATAAPDSCNHFPSIFPVIKRENKAIFAGMTGGPTRILPFLYLGNMLDARNLGNLRNLGVSRILNVSESARAIEEREFEVCHIPISDFGDSELEGILSRCFEFISAAKTADRKILVHCRHGQNRSPTVVIGYLISREKMALRDAYDQVLQLRPMVALHEDYFRQLQILEQRGSGQHTLSQATIGPSVQEIIRNFRQEKKTEK